MASAGDDEREPLIPEDQTGDDDDSLGGDVSTGFNPGEPEAHSSPHSQRKTRLNTHGEIPSFVELPDTPGLSTTTITAENELDKEFRFAEKYKLKCKIENDRLKVGLIAPKKPHYFLTTKVPGKEEYQINPSLTKEVLKALGKSRRDTIEEKTPELTKEIDDYKKIAYDPNENLIERNKAHEYASR